jgi:predicted Zn-dependent protease
MAANKSMPQQGRAAASKAPAAAPAAADATLDGIVPVLQRDVSLMLEAGYLLMELKRHKEAEEVFAGVACLLPKSEVPHMAMGNLLFAQGRFGAASSATSAPRSSTPSPPPPWPPRPKACFFSSATTRPSSRCSVRARSRPAARRTNLPTR